MLIRVEVARDLLQLAAPPRVQGTRVVGSRDGDRRDAEPVAGSKDPGGNLAAVRD
jgi:hypothetical protein